MFLNVAVHVLCIVCVICLNYTSLSILHYYNAADTHQRFSELLSLKLDMLKCGEIAF